MGQSGVVTAFLEARLHRYYYCGKSSLLWIMITDRNNTVVQDDVVCAPYGFAGGLTKLPCLLVGFHTECFDACS